VRGILARRRCSVQHRRGNGRDHSLAPSPRAGLKTAPCRRGLTAGLVTSSRGPRHRPWAEDPGPARAREVSLPRTHALRSAIDGPGGPTAPPGLCPLCLRSPYAPAHLATAGCSPPSPGLLPTTPSGRRCCEPGGVGGAAVSLVGGLWLLLRRRGLRPGRLSRGHGPRAPRAPRPYPGLRQPGRCARRTTGRKPVEWALGRATNPR